MKKGKSYSKDRRQVRAREKAAFRSGAEATKDKSMGYVVRRGWGISKITK